MSVLFKLNVTKNAKVYFGLLMVSIIFVLLFSGSTSPLYPFFYGGDSAQFQTIGKVWAEGGIPYIATFDHKGPFAFFWDMVSFAIEGNNHFLVVIQIICLFVNFVFAYKMAKLYFDEEWKQIAVVVLTSYFTLMAYRGGNHGEDYCVPFLFISSYYLLKYFREIGEEHSWKYAIFYGISFGVCLFSKATNALILGAGILVVFINLLVLKKYKNILDNVVAFIVGTLVIDVPILFYFISKGCLNEMIFAMFTYNATYQQRTVAWITYAGIQEWKSFLIYYFPYYLSVIILVLGIRDKNWKCVLYNLVILIIGGYFFFGGLIAYNYMTVLLPNIPYFIGECGSRWNKGSIERGIGCISVAIVSVIVILSSVELIKYPYETYKNYHNKPECEYDVLLESIPKNELDSFVMYAVGNDAKQVYLVNSISPCYKYFILQSWHSNYNSETKEDIKKVFEEGNAKWIIADEDTKLIDETLATRYNCVQANGKYRLFCLK